LAESYCRDCGTQVRADTRFCPHCGARSPGATGPISALGPATKWDKPSSAPTRPGSRSEGVVSGILACIFGCFGIATLGIIFVPLAALCSVIGMLRGLVGRSISGFSISLMGAFLAFIGVVVSPSLWLLVAGFLAASQNHRATATPGAIISSSAIAPTRNRLQATSTPVPLTHPPATTTDDPHTSPEDHNSYYCLSLRLDYPYTRKCPEPWVTVDSAENEGEYNPLISCGSSGPCFPMEESEAARTAAVEANAENAREARALAVTAKSSTGQ
jgi:hypothetical protein